MDRGLFADNIKFLREKKGFSQEKLGEVLGISKVQISRYEKGNSLPPTDGLYLLAELFEVSLDDLTKVDLRAGSRPGAVANMDIERRLSALEQAMMQQDLVRSLKEKYPEVADELGLK